MSIRIITDSASDITPEHANELGINIIPMKVTFGDKTFLDGIELGHERFFEMLIESDTLPTTSQINPFEYEEEFRKIVDEGDEVICIVLSKALSGCYQSACIAAEEFDGKVSVVDSENACIGEMILVERAVQLANLGKSRKEIVETLEAEKKTICLVALLDTLEYLKKGGRISATAAVAGAILNIKPVIAIEHGEVALKGKARGSKNGNNILKEQIKASGGIDFDKPCMLAYAGFSRAMLDKYLADCQELYEDYDGELRSCSIGSIIGTHIGPGAIAAAFFSHIE